MLRKTGLAIVVLAIILPAAADEASYSEIYKKQTICEQAGTIGASAFKSKKMKVSEEKFRDKVLGRDVHFSDDPIIELRVRLQIATAILNGYYFSADQKDAYMKSWAECMDSY